MNSDLTYALNCAMSRRTEPVPATLFGCVMEEVPLAATIVRSTAKSAPYRVPHVATRHLRATHSGRQRDAVRFVCGGWTINPELLARARREDGLLCRRCFAFTTQPKAAVYRAYDRHGRLLYIGSTGDLRARMQSHDGRSAWWQHAASLDVEPFSTIELARQAEAIAIYREAPLYNVRGCESRRERVSA